MSNDEALTMIFLLLCFAQEQGKELSLRDMLEQERADAEFMKNCPSVEWEQDMHVNIPFCKLDGEMCNMQCKNRKNHPLLRQDLNFLLSNELSESGEWDER